MTERYTTNKVPKDLVNVIPSPDPLSLADSLAEAARQWDVMLSQIDTLLANGTLVGDKSVSLNAKEALQLRKLLNSIDIGTSLAAYEAARKER